MSFIRYLTLLLAIFFTSNCFAEQPEDLASWDLDKICRDIFKDTYTEQKCEDYKNRYWWRDKFPLVDQMVTEVQEAIRKALNSGKLEDYQKLEQYIDFPIDFYGQHDEMRFKTKDKKFRKTGYTWTAHNIKEFKEYLEYIYLNSQEALQELKNGKDKYGRDYYTRYYDFGNFANILSSQYNINLDIECNKFKSDNKKLHINLPSQLHLCTPIGIKLKHISVLYL